MTVTPLLIVLRLVANLMSTGIPGVMVGVGVGVGIGVGVGVGVGVSVGVGVGVEVGVGIGVGVGVGIGVGVDVKVGVGVGVGVGAGVGVAVGVGSGEGPVEPIIDESALKDEATAVPSVQTTLIWYDLPATTPCPLISRHAACPISRRGCHKEADVLVTAEPSK